MKHKHKVLLFKFVGSIILLFVLIVFNLEKVNIYIKDFIYSLQGKSIEKSSVLFSWKISEETEQILNTYQKQLNIDRIFQYIKPTEFIDGYLDAYVLEMKMRDLAVYAMDGGYYWGTTDYGYEELLCFVDRVSEYNLSHDDNKIEGIVLDVEPAQDVEWKNNEDTMMKKYVEYIIQAYEYASKKRLKVVVCIPYWYDEKHETELRRLAQYGCDEIAVMNYYCGKEIDLIETEVSIAKEYGKPIMSIFEFAEPDNNSVFKQNTYFFKGVHAAEEAFKEMDKFFNYKKLTVGWHQLLIE